MGIWRASIISADILKTADWRSDIQSLESLNILVLVNEIDSIIAVLIKLENGHYRHL